ncbi:hypothetical protein BH20ACI2_BH20ACI2_10100 [soil metagenome]
MSLTLGEKLRQAREERGFTISDVAEQTRISSLYLQSIEDDDYNILPGGIFNKGFVKSFAKFVGVNEQEALEDYTRLISKNEGGNGGDLKVFRPEVLTDDRSAASMAPTIIIAAIILAIMTVGVLFLVDYLRQPSADLTANTKTSNSNAAAEVPIETPQTEVSSPAPDMSSLKVEFTAVSEPVSLLVTTDGKTSSTTVASGASVLFEPKESLKLSYSRSLASVVQLNINGKKIGLPAQPLVPRRNAIEWEVNKENLGRIWETGAISGESNTAEIPTEANSASANIGTTFTVPPPTRPVSTPAPRPARAANVGSDPSTPSPRPPANAGNASTPRSTPSPVGQPDGP